MAWVVAFHSMSCECEILGASSVWRWGNKLSPSVRNKNEIDIFFATPVDEEVDSISA